MISKLLNAFAPNGGQPAQPTPEGYQSPFQDMNPLLKIAIGLGGTGSVQNFENMARRQYQQNALAELATKMQSGEIDRQQGLIDYAGITGDYSGLFGAGSRAPAALQEWNAFNNMTEDEQQQYLRMKRSTKTVNTGDSVHIVDDFGNTINTFDRNLSPEAQPQTKFDQERARRLGGQQADNEGGFSKLKEQAQMMLSTIDKALEDEKGLEASVGGFAGLKGRQSSMLALGADQRRFQPLIDQLKGQSFLEAFDRLKGAGAITETEGRNAAKAIARLDQAQDPEDFRAALFELRSVVESGLSRKADKANTDLFEAGNFDASIDPVAAHEAARKARAQELGYEDRGSTKANLPPPVESSPLSSEDMSELERLRRKYGR